jgi:hypothetical protein
MDMLRRPALFSSLVVLLTACSSLPGEAEQARLHSFCQADLLPGEPESGVEEAWCVEVDHLCYDCARQQLGSCITSYLVRLTAAG